VKLRSIGSPTETNPLRIIFIFFEGPTVLVVSHMPGVLKEGQAINTVIVVRVLTIAVSVALAIGGTASAQQAEPPPFRAPDLEQDWIEKIDRLRYLIEEQLRQQRQHR